jgi:hypothetical protein
MFDARLQPAIHRATRSGGTVRFSTTHPRAVFDDYPGPGLTGYFEQGSVRIESGSGHRSRSRADG